MSVRAYKVEQLKLGKNSFNLSFDTKITDYLNRSGYTESLGVFSNGLLELPLEAVQEIVNFDGISDDTKKQLSEDIRWAKRRKIDSINYYCQ